MTWLQNRSLCYFEVLEIQASLLSVPPIPYTAGARSSLAFSYLVSMSELAAEFAIYQRFDDQASMQELGHHFTENDIPFKYQAYQNPTSLGSDIVGTSLAPAYWIEIPAALFPKANEVLYALAEETIDDADLVNHPFATYATNELKEVLLEAESWDPEAVVIARRLLLQRDPGFDFAQLLIEKTAKQATAFEAKKVHPLTILALSLLGVLSGLTLWFFGFLVALGFLAYYRLGGERDHDGVRHDTYDKPTQTYSFWAVVATALGLICGLIYYFKMVAGFAIDRLPF